VSEFTASIRRTGAISLPGDSVLEGDDEASGEGVPVTVGCGSFSAGSAAGVERVAEGDAEGVAEGWPDGAGTASTRDLSSMASKVIKTALTKTNPPMAAFDQWPFRLSGMRRSLTGRGRGRPTRQASGRDRLL
jgi:hypothetical protein